MASFKLYCTYLQHIFLHDAFGVINDAAIAADKNYNNVTMMMMIYLPIRVKSSGSEISVGYQDVDIRHVP